MVELITLFIYVLASARGIRFVVKDKLTEKFRVWWEARYPGRDSLRRYLITCAWCVSVYLVVGPAISWVVAPHHRVLKSLAAVMAFSWLATVALKLSDLLEAKIKLYSPPAVPDEVTDGESAQAARP